MTNSSTVFQQILQLIPDSQLAHLVDKYKTDRYSKKFTTANLLTSLLYAQCKGKDSLRDIETGLLTHANNFYHLGLPENGVKRSTLAEANSRVDFRVFQELFSVILEKYSSKLFRQKFNFDETVYAVDSTFVELVINLYPWAKYRATKGAIKMHTALNLNLDVPSIIHVTDGTIHDLQGASFFAREEFRNAIIVFDKGYWSAYRFALLNKRDSYFVTRIKTNVKYKVTGQQRIQLGTGVLKDEIIEFTTNTLIEDYPEKLRLVTFYDKKNDKLYKFITNAFHLTAKTIADIYKYRWKVELFFKWIKQHLVVKSFLECSRNAVFNQIWIALIYYLLISHIHSQTRYKYSKLELTRVLAEVLFDRMSLIDILAANFKSIQLFKAENTQQLFLMTG